MPLKTPGYDFFVSATKASAAQFVRVSMLSGDSEQGG